MTSAKRGTRVKLGTRGSKLALWQANHIQDLLSQQEIESELIIIHTHGDLQRSSAITSLGSQGVFTREIQRALLDRTIDMAIHSLKDLPTDPVDGLVLAAVPGREDVRDVLVGPYTSLEMIPDNAKIGTGSLRRKTQLLHLLDSKKMMVHDIRGNVETRLRKQEEGEYDLLVLAAAGLIRLGLKKKIAGYLDPNIFLPAVGQGAIAIECRSNDSEILNFAETINDPLTYCAVLAERALLKTLEGGCIAPIGAMTCWTNHQLRLQGRILSTDASILLETVQEDIFPSLTFTENMRNRAVQLGISGAQNLLSQGADKIIAELNAVRASGK